MAVKITQIGDLQLLFVPEIIFFFDRNRLFWLYTCFVYGTQWFSLNSNHICPRRFLLHHCQFGRGGPFRPISNIIIDLCPYIHLCDLRIVLIFQHFCKNELNMVICHIKKNSGLKVAALSHESFFLHYSEKRCMIQFQMEHFSMKATQTRYE